MPVLKIKNNGVWEQVSGIPDHTHVIDDITDFPTSLPANGGNADTVDGKHASDFASAAEMTTVQNDINDINTMLNGIEIPTELPNPNALRFTGAVNASYNGSSEVSVEIPDAYGATETVIFSLDSVKFTDDGDGTRSASIDVPMPFTEVGIYKVKIGNRSGIAGISQKDIDDWNDNYKEYGEYIDIDLWDIFRDEKNLNESFPDGLYYNNTTLTLYDNSIEAGEYPVSITKVDVYPSIKMDKVNPTAIGSFSLNRKPGSAIGNYSHAEGQLTTASGTASHAEGANTTASASCSHAEGANTIASGPAAHAEGYITTASGRNSHAEGQVTTAKSENQHVQGKHNIEDSSGVYADIIGNGIASKRSNAATVDWHGNAWYAGDVYVGSTSGTNKDEGSKKLATEEYVNNSAASIEIPTTLPNPNALAFTGAVTGSYDGSNPLTVEIPSGDSIVPAPSSADNGKFLGCENGAAVWKPVEASGGGDKWELINEFTIPEGAEESNKLSLTKDSNGNDFVLKKALLLSNFPPYTGESTIPNFSFASINGITSGSAAEVPIGYTSVWPVLSKTSDRGCAYFVDVSGIFWIEKALRTDTSKLRSNGIRIFTNINQQNNIDKEWMAIPNVIGTIREIGGTAMLIYPGCWFALYGVRA